MRFKVPIYTDDYSVVSLTLNEDVHRDLLAESVRHWYVNGKKIEVFPEEIELQISDDTYAKLQSCNNYDAFEVFSDGTAVRCYDSCSDDTVFFVTGKCNSNCIICPTPERLRRISSAANVSRLIMMAGHIPTNAAHITITGGEPFMAGKELFKLLDFCRSKFQYTEFLILTNGRVFAIPEYMELINATLPCNSILGIPLHGSRSETHDVITNAPGSYNQTLIGLRRLQKSGIRIELRIVVCKTNINDIPDIADLIIKKLPNVERVCIMAMELTGSARVNADAVWIPYRESFSAVKTAVNKLIRAGINVRLYNYPLCTVEQPYWTVCQKSISSEKIRYADNCSYCKVRESCGGVFAGSFSMLKDELEPV